MSLYHFDMLLLEMAPFALLLRRRTPQQRVPELNVELHNILRRRHRVERWPEQEDGRRKARSER
jgi:hypothetical protein